MTYVIKTDKSIATAIRLVESMIRAKSLLKSSKGKTAKDSLYKENAELARILINYISKRPGIRSKVIEGSLRLSGNGIEPRAKRRVIAILKNAELMGIGPERPMMPTHYYIRPYPYLDLITH